ncbi:TonB-dependent receptor [candidate division KSB1 bacterium]|nr:TonB-dependent receptor [candidate division KSB1 bacterium]
MKPDQFFAFNRLARISALIFVFSLKLIFARENLPVIRGTVLDIRGKPLSNVQVQLNPGDLADVTDDNGAFVFDKIPWGTYTLKLSHIGYESRFIENLVIAKSTSIDLGEILLRSRVINFDAILVTATRTPKNILTLSNTVNMVSETVLRQRNAKTSAEALREESGIFVQKTNHGGGSAILRGLSSNQILILVDGIRLNNSTYRLGNHQYLTTIDNNSADRIEVVRGPGSVLYGSDALGGTINVITRSPAPTTEHPAFQYHLLGRYASADNERTIHGHIGLSKQRYAFHTGFSAKAFGDLRRGKNSRHAQLETSTNGLLQTPTGYTAYDYDAKFIFSCASAQSILLAYQLSKQKDVPRYDKYINDEYYLWRYQPQDRELMYARYQHTLESSYVKSIQATLSWQRQSEGRQMQSTVSSPLTCENDLVNTAGFNLQIESILPNQQLLFGTDVYLDNVRSERVNIDPTSSARQKDSRGRYPDDAAYTSIGIFLQDDVALSQKLHLIFGIRYSLFRAKFNLPPSNDESNLNLVEQNFQAATARIGGNFDINKYVTLKSTIARAFRAPNLSDLSKLGESKGDTYEVPNPDLQPEKLLSWEFGVAIRSTKVQFDAVWYHSRLTDLIANADARYNGSGSIRIADVDYKIKSKQNLGDAVITGFESAFDVYLSPSFTFRSNFTSTYGENTTLHEPIGGIPPAFGLVGLNWQHDTHQFECFVRFAASQKRLSADDEDDPRIPIGGTPGWWTLNSRLVWQLWQTCRLQLALENMLDVNYREHGSGINGPGRNLILSLAIQK